MTQRKSIKITKNRKQPSLYLISHILSRLDKTKFIGLFLRQKLYILKIANV